MRNISETDLLDQDVTRLGQLLLELGRRRPLRDPIARSMEDSGLSHVQVHALMWLGNDDRLTMGELAQRVGITEKTITGVVDRLERDSLVSRAKDTKDRRVVRLCLTRRGLTQFRKLRQLAHQRMSNVLGLLDPPDRDALCRIVTKLLDRMPGCARLSALPGARKESSK